MTQLNDSTQTTQSKIIKKKIKSVEYEVTIHFNEKSRETMNDKIARLIRNEVAS
jgi:hypothetical protein